MLGSLTGDGRYRGYAAEAVRGSFHAYAGLSEYYNDKFWRDV
jgi:hypothetical protein